MQVLKLISQHHIPLPHFLGKKIGDGADGEVFKLPNCPDKVIKLSIIFDEYENSPLFIYQNRILPILEYLWIENPPICPIVFEHGYFGQLMQNPIGEFSIHYCVMERLLPLTEDENKVFHSVVSHEDREIKKDLSPIKINEMLLGLAFGLDFDLEMIMLFCEQLRESKIKQKDLHPRNILKNGIGQFKIIDFDRIILEK
jgi:hypothetical protein